MKTFMCQMRITSVLMLLKQKGMAHSEYLAQHLEVSKPSVNRATGIVS